MWIVIFFLGIWGAEQVCSEGQKCTAKCKCGANQTEVCTAEHAACIRGKVESISEVLEMGQKGDGKKYCVSVHADGFAKNCTNDTHVCNKQATTLDGLCVAVADLKTLSTKVEHEKKVLEPELTRCIPEGTTYEVNDDGSVPSSSNGDGALRCHKKDGKTSCICVQTAVCIQDTSSVKCVLAKTFTGIEHGDQATLTTSGCFADDFNSTGVDWTKWEAEDDAPGAVVCGKDKTNKQGCICKKGAYCDLSNAADVKCISGNTVLKHGEVSVGTNKCFGKKTASTTVQYTTDAPAACVSGDTCNRSGVGKVCLKDEDMLGVNEQASLSSKRLCFGPKTYSSLVKDCIVGEESCNPHATQVNDLCLKTALIVNDCPSTAGATEYWHLEKVAGKGAGDVFVKCGAPDVATAAPVVQSSVTCDAKNENDCNSTAKESSSDKKACFWHSDTCQPLTCKNWAGTFTDATAKKKFCTNDKKVYDEKECKGDKNECTAAECCTKSDSASSKSVGDWIKNNTTIFVAMIVFGAVFLVVSATCCWLMCNKGRGRELKSSFNNLFKKKDDAGKRAKDSGDKSDLLKVAKNEAIRDGRKKEILKETRSPSSPRDKARIVLDEITSYYQNELPRRKKGNADANPRSDHGLLGSRSRNEKNPLGPQSPKARNERSPLQPQFPRARNERSPQSPRSPNERSPLRSRSPDERSPLKSRSRSPDERSPLRPQSPNGKSPDPSSKKKKKGKGKGMKTPKEDSGGRKEKK